MRFLVLALAAVVLAGTAVGAQEASPSAVGFLCEHAFSVLAEEAAADDDTSQGAEQVRSTFPPPIPGSGLLDEAIHMCADIDELVAATRRYPAVFEGVDVLSFVTARCEDAASGLHDFATCNSLRRALATPSPGPLPTPVPTVLPESSRPPTAGTTRRPSETPPPTREPRVDRPRRATTPRRRTGMTRVPSDYEAPVPGATRVHYFRVAGPTSRALHRSIERQAARYCDTRIRAAACMQTKGRVQATYVRDLYTGSCTITGVLMPLAYVAHIPRWTSPGRVPTFMVWWWRRDAYRIGWHEAQHVRIARRSESKLRTMAVGKPCHRFDRLVRRWGRALDREQNAFDRLDYPRHAKASQRWWREAYERFPPRP